MILLSNCCYHLRIKMNFTLNPVLQEQLPRLAKKISTINPEDIPENLLECLEQNNHTRILEELLQLFSQEFQKYIQGAFTQDWPFLPPTINPTMMVESNPKIPKLNQVELLLLCLNSAFNNEDYRMALSIAFVIDRFVYYCDGSAALLKIVDCIRKLSPSTPVAPQLIIRSARVMKDNGDLHGSIQILNRLIEEKWEDLPNCNDPARWQYKEEEQYINVAAVCVQIKGQIYHNLSLWKEAIGPLMQSIEGFNRLSVKDYKGISYTYSLLSRCLCRLSKTEYRNLRQEYSFQFENHCYQAYEFGMLAYDYCPGQRLFLSKHLLLSGECLLMYAVQLPDETLRYEMFFKILEILNLVFYKQNLEELSQSKDQLFNFIKSLFVTCLTLGCSANHFDRYMGNYLEAICLFVYKKFCDIGANQLDSEIGKQNLKQIIPALTFALITISQQYPNRSGSRGNNGFTAANMLNKTGDHVHASIDSTMNKTENVDPGKNVRMDQFNRNPIVADNAERIIGVKPDTSSNMSNARWMHVTIGAAERLQNLRRRTLEMGNRIMDDLMDSEKLGMEAENDPVVDVELATQIRGKIAKQKTKNNDEKEDNQEGSVKQEKGSRMLDYDAVTPERVVMVKEVPVEDCEAVTRDKMVMREEETPRVDSEAINQENVDINREGNQIVNHEVVNREKMVVQKGTPMVDCDAVTQKRLVKEIPMRDCDTVTQDEGVMQEGTPMVDCDAVTQKREAKEIPMRDCDAVTQDKGVMQEGTPMVDCDAVTQKRLVKEIPTTDCDMVTQDKEVMQEGTPMVDCDAVTQKREAKVIPMRDCDAVTQDKEVMQKGTPMVDCDAVTQKREAKEIPTTDCDMVTQNKEVMQEGTPMVDCDSVTQKMETKEIPMRDCDAVTQDKVVMQERTLMVDCVAGTQERTPMTDCEAVTQERMVTQTRKIPLVDCKAVTQERVVMQTERVVMQTEEAPIIDSEEVSQEGSARFDPLFARIDCIADTQERVYDTYVSFNVFSDLDNMGYSFPEEFWTLSIKPQRIVGLPSRISMIESKVSALDSLCQTFEDFNVDYDSSLTPRSKDASLVNTKALTLICQSKKDGTYLPNRLLTKFQRQESLPWEQQLNNPVTESMKQVSLTSFLGDLLKQNHEIISSLHSKTDSRKEDLNDQHESINKVQKATLYEYNPVTCVWSGQDTIVCTGKELTLGKGKKGQFRNVYQINYLHQEEPLGKYVSKRYRNQRESLQYMDDVVCQMQAGLYVNLFNQALKMFELDLRIYFLNAAFMLLYNSQGEVEDWMNIEPFVDGEFIKLTSNYDFCDPRGKNVSTSFTHFTYVQSGYQMMVCDLQGWLPSGTQNLIYLTDPQFHTDSGDSSPFDFGQEGIKLFFDVVHPECNEICQILKLQRPTF